MSFKPIPITSLAAATGLPDEELRLVLESVRRSGLVRLDEAAGTVAADAAFMDGAAAKRKIVLPSLIVLKRAQGAAPPTSDEPPVHTDPNSPTTGRLARAKGALAYVVSKALGSASS
uniref:Uncharacterized protein n=1 Tax=Neobodo designis TaxID=312471 RepID=A0A7S1QQ20_NEODS|mmetsp:Transcript_5014/g.15831  ORF Transcript_5014/g.15831 Transcript_5014/m.15831 type:complete len:117 (+) Transcript_5014:1-351(+)